MKGEVQARAKRERDSAKPREKRSNQRRFEHEWSECKPDAKRKRNSAQPQERAPPSRNE